MKTIPIMRVPETGGKRYIMHPLSGYFIDMPGLGNPGTQIQSADENVNLFSRVEPEAFPGEEYFRKMFFFFPEVITLKEPYYGTVLDKISADDDLDVSFSWKFNAPVPGGGNHLGSLKIEYLQETYDPAFAWDNLPATMDVAQAVEISLDQPPLIGVLTSQARGFSLLKYPREGHFKDLLKNHPFAGIGLTLQFQNVFVKPQIDYFELTVGSYGCQGQVDESEWIWPDGGWAMYWDRDNS